MWWQKIVGDGMKVVSLLNIYPCIFIITLCFHVDNSVRLD